MVHAVAFWFASFGFCSLFVCALVFACGFWGCEYFGWIRRSCDFCSTWRELSNAVYIFFTQGHVVCHVSMHGNLECCTIFSRDEGACWRFISHRIHPRLEWRWCPWIIYWLIIPFNHCASPFVTCAHRKAPWNLASRSVSGENTCVGLTLRHHNSSFRSPLDIPWARFFILLWFILMVLTNSRFNTGLIARIAPNLPSWSYFYQPELSLSDDRTSYSGLTATKT